MVPIQYGQLFIHMSVTFDHLNKVNQQPFFSPATAATIQKKPISLFVPLSQKVIICLTI